MQFSREHRSTVFGLLGLVLSVCVLVVLLFEAGVNPFHPASGSDARGDVRPAVAAAIGTPEQAATAAAPARISLPSIGQLLRIGNLGWKVTNVQTLGKRIKGATSSVAELVARGHFVRVRYYVENTSRRTIAGTGRLKLIDAQGHSFTPKTVDDAFVDAPCNTSASLDPGASTTCEAIYDVPDSVHGLKLEVVGQDGVLGTSSALIDLEL